MKQKLKLYGGNLSFFILAAVFFILSHGEVPVKRTLLLICFQVFVVFIPGMTFFGMTGISLKNELAVFSPLMLSAMS